MTPCGHQLHSMVGWRTVLKQAHSLNILLRSDRGDDLLLALRAQTNNRVVRVWLTGGKE